GHQLRTADEPAARSRAGAALKATGEHARSGKAISKGASKLGPVLDYGAQRVQGHSPVRSLGHAAASTAGGVFGGGLGVTACAAGTITTAGLGSGACLLTVNGGSFGGSAAASGGYNWVLDHVPDKPN